MSLLSGLVELDYTQAGITWSSFNTGAIYYSIDGGTYQGPAYNNPLIIPLAQNIVAGTIHSIALSEDGSSVATDFQFMPSMDLVVSNMTDNSITLNWDTNGNYQTPYSIYVNNISPQSAQPPYTIPITQGTTYSIVVQAQVPSSGKPLVARSQILYLNPTPAPVILTCLVDPTQIIIDNPNAVEGFTLVIDGTPTTSNPTLPYQIIDLDPLSQHTVYLQNNNLGTSDTSSQTTTINTPLMLATGGVTNTTVSLILDPQNKGNGSYEIYRNGTYLTTVGNAYDDMTVTAGTSYQYQFLDPNSGNYGVWSNMLYVTVPTTPSNPLKFGITWFFSP